MSSNVSKKKNQKDASDENLETQEFSLHNDKNEIDKSNDEIEELRRLIVQAEEVSEVLPVAVERSSKKDNKLTEATLPIVEENIRQSVVRDPKILAEALFPVIGPAIRKAIAEALSSMVQNLNQTLEHSISPKSIGWRLEAIKTGKSFGEVVMLKTLRYRVEQVFLIHKKTGLLLQHVAANPNDMEDADMVSAMLTAITDFVHDSFKTSDNATLDSLKINELTVWIESSPDAVIAAVIRGNPPLTLREVFDEATEKIQFNHEDDLDNFSGNSEVFETSRPVLENCLRFQSNENETSKESFFSPTRVLASVLGLLLLVGAVFYVRDYLLWSGYIEQLQSEQGIVVVESNRGWWTHSVKGLRDPLSANPTDILMDFSYDVDEIEQNWKTYQDGSPKFILRRAEKYLRPPQGVSLKLENQTLIADGSVPQEWYKESNKLVPLLLGVDDFKIANDEFMDIVNKIQSINLFFTCGSINLSENQSSKFDELVKDIEKIIDLDKNVKLEMLSFTNSTGTDEANLNISNKRAEVIITELESRSSRIKNLQQTNSKFINILANGKSLESDDCKFTLKISPQ